MTKSESTNALDGEVVRIEGAPEALTMFLLENVVVVVWCRPLTAEIVKGWHSLLVQHLERLPREPRSHVSFVHVSRVELTKMSVETRDAFVHTAKVIGPHAAGIALLVPAHGFWASTLRSVSTGVMALARVSYPTRFFNLPSEVVAWLPENHERMTGVKLDREQLERVLVRAVALQAGLR